ncbi:uncharacterized protein GBIM_20246, partial [Gryllus bimaculatus]
MPRVCCIKTCLYSKAKNCRNIKLPLFRLPRDPTMQEKWLSIADGKMRKMQATPKIIYFCEKHFEESDIIRTFDVVIGNIRDTIPCNLVKLKSSAVPRIFHDSSSSKNDIKKNLSKRKDASETINKNRNHLPANSVCYLAVYLTVKITTVKREQKQKKLNWICEEHFTDDCFHYVLTKLRVEGKNPRRVKKLKHGSIPTLNLNLPKLRRNTITETNSEINSDDQNVCSHKNEQFRCGV